jgi:hypothetical protein
LSTFLLSVKPKATSMKYVQIMLFIVAGAAE